MSKAEFITPVDHKQVFVGMTIGRLTIISEADRVRGSRAWQCLCQCGTEIVRVGSQLIREIKKCGGVRTSCGCLLKELTVARSFVHGHMRTTGNGRSPEYVCWGNIKIRCYKPNAIGYHIYGGRGIRMCERWRNSFEAFLEDMGLRPSPKHSIDRRDNDGHYSCGGCDECLAKGWLANCRWLTKKQQCRNTSHNSTLTINGISKTMAEWGDVLDISPSLLSDRHQLGWSDERVLTQPIRKHGSRAQVSLVEKLMDLGIIQKELEAGAGI